MAEKSQDEVIKKLDDYKEKVRNDVEVLLKKTFPEKVLKLNEMLKSDRLNRSKVKEIHVSCHLKKKNYLSFKYTNSTKGILDF